MKEAIAILFSRWWKVSHHLLLEKQWISIVLLSELLLIYLSNVSLASRRKSICKSNSGSQQHCSCLFVCLFSCSLPSQAGSFLLLHPQITVHLCFQALLHPWPSICSSSYYFHFLFPLYKQVIYGAYISLLLVKAWVSNHSYPQGGSVRFGCNWWHCVYRIMHSVPKPEKFLCCWLAARSLKTFPHYLYLNLKNISLGKAC